MDLALHISLDGAFDASVSRDLKELQEKLQREGVLADPVSLTIEGAKSVLIIGLSIASLTLSSISTAIAVLNFWQGQKKKSYRVVLIGRGGATPIADLSSEAVQAAANEEAAPHILIEKI